ncbi:MAG: formylglycine-generating enzyme family protein [Gammaproteobacteria bacterium]
MDTFRNSLLCITLLLGLPAAAGAVEVIENFLAMRFVRVPAGEFVMGTEDIEAARREVPEPDVDTARDEAPAHRVVISQPFLLGETEVTQGVWLRVMENRPGPAALWSRPDWAQLPVSAASWYMAARFVEELNALDTDYRYRLPSEAEWEYAARAGNPGLRPVPLDELEENAWFINNSEDIPQPVATRRPNAFGLYDMLGNVWEWVADWYAPDGYAASTITDPAGPGEGVAKVRRGGSYHCPSHLVRPAYRSANTPDTAWTVLGFRVVAEPRRLTTKNYHRPVSPFLVPSR